ncbi:hypothetical protein Vi05172_g1710 [Venturia inaequalis]|nr:hypothetical protein Vi05172_g1710 [Venturia inaequalis]
MLLDFPKTSNYLLIKTLRKLLISIAYKVVQILS